MSDLLKNGREMRNRPLASLPDRDYEILRSHLFTFELSKGDRVTRQGQETRSVYFPLVGSISLTVTMEDGRSVVASTIGPEGIFDAVAALGTGCSTGDTIVQAAGSALRLDRQHLINAMGQSEAIHKMVMLSVEALTAYSLQSLACSNYHAIEARFCRWVLMVRDQLQSADLPLTQEDLAAMLGVQRTSITGAALHLQNAGLIAYRRGNIHILDVARVENAACECYRRVRESIERAFPPATA